MVAGRPPSRILVWRLQRYFPEGSSPRFSGPALAGKDNGKEEPDAPPHLLHVDPAVQVSFAIGRFEILLILGEVGCLFFVFCQTCPLFCIVFGSGDQTQDSTIARPLPVFCFL